MKMLNQQSTWILSLGKTGRLADFKSCNLDESNLDKANFEETNLLAVLF